MNNPTHKFNSESCRLKVDVSTQNTFDFASEEYRDLFSNSEATAFQHPNWLSVFYRMLVPNRDAQKLIITGRDTSTGTLIFLLPLIRRDIRNVVLIESADLGVSDYSAPIIRKGLVENLRQYDALSKSIAAAIGKYDVLRIKPIRDEMRQYWAVFFKSSPNALNFSAHASVIKAPYDAWRLEAFGKSHAKYIDRKTRRFEKNADVTLEIVPDNEIDEAIGFVQEQRKGRFEGDPIQQDLVRSFYTCIAKYGGPNGIARTYQMKANGQRVGVIFGLIHNQRYYYLLIGCDYQSYGKHSPGLIMYDRIMASWSEEGGKVFDFTIGDEPFKAKFGTKPTQMYEILEAGSLLGRLAKLAYELKNRMT